MGAGLFNALKAMSSGCQGPVSSKPAFLVGWASAGMGTSSLSLQRHWLSRSRKLSIMPCTIWRQVQNCPVTGSLNLASHLGHPYFSRTGAGDSSSSRRALRAAAIDGRSSRVRVAMASSTLTSRPFTFLVPNKSGNFSRISLRTMARLLNSFYQKFSGQAKQTPPLINSDSRRFPMIFLKIRVHRLYPCHQW